ncbi:MAG: [FeFe] hydrogenase H-cluster radical SAM maturase HydE [Bdellovibrionota bacterium]|jgi:biotin synthase
MIGTLEKERILSRADFKELLSSITQKDRELLFERARGVRHAVYGRDVFVRGLIEFSNYCKNDCYYCGIRRSNTKASRYRLTTEEILESCQIAYENGFRTFVLQSGEDAYFTDKKIVDLVKEIRSLFPSCAITLSIGERDKKAYQDFFDAGAERYLLREESANPVHYATLHPSGQSLASRKRALFNLKEIGYQVGCGFMVGSPYQTLDHIIDDLIFIHDLDPQMVGIGPFIPHQDTPFAKADTGSVDLTLTLLAIIRLMIPTVLLPTTTALATLQVDGRIRGILAGANVVMPNITPLSVRKKYLIYDNKACTDLEAAEGFNEMKKQLADVGYQVVISRGDCASFRKGI